MILRDLSHRRKHDTLWLALGFVLQDLREETSTKVVAAWLQARLDIAPAEMPVVMVWLKKIAPRVPEARQTGDVIKAYGHYGRRWIWSPRRAGPAASAVVDTSNW